MSIRPYLKRLLEARESLSRGEAADLLRLLLESPVSEAEVGALLGALAARGETTEEIAGFADTLRAMGTAIPLSAEERDGLVDTCGTGGDGSGTFNISTAAALVAAAAGARVAKHGNRAVTSACGSADVLEAMGVPVGLSAEEAAVALRTEGFAFLHAPSMHPSMRAVMPVRRALGVRTVFNILGPLANPAGASRQVMGVYAPHLVPLVAEAMAKLGTRHGLVVHGESGVEGGGGMDELSISGASQVAEVRGGAVRMYTLRPEEVGLRSAPMKSLRGGDARENAAILMGIFEGRTGGGARDVVLLNAAAVLVTADLAAELGAGVTLAARMIDEGRVTELVRRLRVFRKAKKVREVGRLV